MRGASLDVPPFSQQSFSRYCYYFTFGRTSNEKQTIKLRQYKSIRSATISFYLMIIYIVATRNTVVIAHSKLKKKRILNLPSLRLRSELGRKISNIGWSVP